MTLRNVSLCTLQCIETSIKTKLAFIVFVYWPNSQYKSPVNSHNMNYFTIILTVMRLMHFKNMFQWKYSYLTHISLQLFKFMYYFVNLVVRIPRNLPYNNLYDIDILLHYSIIIIFIKTIACMFMDIVIFARENFRHSICLSN